MIDQLVQALGIFIAGSGVAAIVAFFAYIAKLLIGIIRSGRGE